MEIKKFFKESNELNDISGDYVVIKMSKSTYLRMKEAITVAKIWRDEKKYKPLEEAFEEAYKKGKAVWY